MELPMSRAPTIITVDVDDPSPSALEPAAKRLRDGGLVAFPTETVYGLGANALDEAAVARIFEAKRRPATNPLIVHVADVEGARDIVAEWPDHAQKLAEAFWPGPLTLVLPRQKEGEDTVPNSIVASAVSAGLDTVGVRIPAHPVALELIRLAGVPVAAPSANRYTEVSPTLAEHVVDSLGGAVDIVVDAGATNVGVESTVLSLVGGRVEILRPGMITRDQIEAVVAGAVYAADASPETTQVEESQRRPSPGLAKKHYAPSAELRVVDDLDALFGLVGAAKDTSWMVLEPFSEAKTPRGRVEVMGREPGAYAEKLYAVLRDLDRRGVDTILVERPPEGDAWRAIHDRLARASH
jgi:L-threonylcarbamoyladenylate synthase